MTNFSIPKIGYGTWMFGGTKDPNPNNDDASDIKALRDAIDLGITHIDAAENYANGKCEEIVGEAIKGYDRSKLLIASKVRPAKLNYDSIISNCEKSLERLGIDYLDLYYVHKPNPDIPVAETAKAFNDLMDRGLIKNIGISNASVETMREYQKHLKHPIKVCQNQYSLIFRESAHKGILDFCAKEGIQFLAWRPLQRPLPEKDVKSLYTHGNFPTLDAVADKYGKTPAQVAIKWLITQDNVNVVFNSKKPTHLKEIIDCENFDIAQTDLDKLTNDFEDQRNVGLLGLV